MLIVTAKNWPEKDETAGKYQQGWGKAAFRLNKDLFNKKKQSFASSLTCRITESGAVTKRMSSCWDTDKRQQKTRINSAPHNNLWLCNSPLQDSFALWGTGAESGSMTELQTRNSAHTARHGKTLLNSGKFWLTIWVQAPLWPDTAHPGRTQRCSAQIGHSGALGTDKDRDLKQRKNRLKQCKNNY